MRFSPGEEDCSCVIKLGTSSTFLNTKKEGLCSFTLQSSPGSQVRFTNLQSSTFQVLLNFLGMNLPSLNPEEGCEAWVSLGEDHQSVGSLIGELEDKNLNNFCTGSKRFCGLTVPNYPGPSVITSSSNSMVLSYNLPAESIVQGHGFQVEKLSKVITFMI